MTSRGPGSLGTSWCSWAARPWLVRPSTPWRHARVALCGLISEYNSTTGPVGARNLWQLIVKSARVEGFFTGDFLPRFAEAQAAMSAWLAEGRLKVDEHVDQGLENAVPAFLRLFAGTNAGKLMLKIA